MIRALEDDFKTVVGIRQVTMIKVSYLVILFIFCSFNSLPFPYCKFLWHFGHYNEFLSSFFYATVGICGYLWLFSYC